jgi:hypothetical protein
MRRVGGREDGAEPPGRTRHPEEARNRLIRWGLVPFRAWEVLLEPPGMTGFRVRLKRFSGTR